MKIAIINSNEPMKKGMLPNITNNITFGGFYRPCQPVNPTTSAEETAPNPGFKGKHVIPTDDRKGGTLNIIA